MSSNYLDTVVFGSCLYVCVPEVLTRVFNAFVSNTKHVHLQHNKCVRLLFGRCFRNSPKRAENREKVSVKLHFI